MALILSEHDPDMQITEIKNQMTVH